MAVVVLFFLGVDNIYFLAAILFVTSIVPVVGAVFASLVVFVMATLQPDGSLALALQSLVALAIIHAVVSLVSAPFVYGKSFHIHPVLVLVILVIAEHFFGIWGLVLGVPVVVYLIQIILRSSNPHPQNSTVAG